MHEKLPILYMIKIKIKFSSVLAHMIFLNSFLAQQRLLLSADNLYKQFGPRSGFKPFDILIVFLKEFFEKGDFEKSQQTACKELKKALVFQIIGASGLIHNEFYMDKPAPKQLFQQHFCGK